jgi:hypothetical protein
MRLLSCTGVDTACDDAEGGSLFALYKHLNFCGEHQVLLGWRLARCDDPSLIRFHLTCCVHPDYSNK